MMVISACPVCGASDGFHDDLPHAEAATRIPARLLRPPHSTQREADRQRRREDYEEWQRAQAS